MKTGPKYKIARRLGAPIFEKTQTPKYTLSLQRKERTAGRGRRRKPQSEYALQLIEKQKARFTYGVSEKQFRLYVNKALHAPDPAQKLFSLLESRLDNTLFRLGLAKTRAQARQMASHGHVLVNDRRVTVPSILLSKGDVVSLRSASSGKALFAEAAERIKAVDMPPWLKADIAKMKAEVTGEAVYAPQEQLFDLRVVIEYYSR